MGTFLNLLIVDRGAMTLVDHLDAATGGVRGMRLKRKRQTAVHITRDDSRTTILPLIIST